MIELDWSIGGEDLGVQPCDGVICATPPGSTAYNLSNGGPVLVWGLDAMVVTFVAPHSLHARPLVVGRDTDLVVTNRSPDIDAVVLVDGHRDRPSSPPGEQARMHLGPARSQLATAARADVLPPLRRRLRHRLSRSGVAADRAAVARRRVEIDEVGTTDGADLQRLRRYRRRRGRREAAPPRAGVRARASRPKRTVEAVGSPPYD